MAYEYVLTEKKDRIGYVILKPTEEAQRAEQTVCQRDNRRSEDHG